MYIPIHYVTLGERERMRKSTRKNLDGKKQALKAMKERRRKRSFKFVMREKEKSRAVVWH